MFKFLSTILIALVVSYPATAQSRCLHRGNVEDILKRNFNEDVEIVGIINDNAIVEIFVSPSGETWTIVVTGKNMITCYIMAGEHLRIIKRHVEPES